MTLLPNRFSESAFNRPSAPVDALVHIPISCPNQVSPLSYSLCFAIMRYHLLASQWLRKRINIANTLLDSSVNSAITNVVHINPLCKRFGCAVNAYKYIRSSVIRLLTRCRYSAILRRVVTVIVDPVKAHPVRNTDNIFNEVTNVMPSLAYTNTSATIRCVGRIIGFIAPSVHASVSAFKCMVAKAVRGISMNAPTRPVLFVIKSSSFPYGAVSAIAMTKPIRSFCATILNRMNSSEMPECLSGYIFREWVKWYNFISHFVTSNNRLIRWRDVEASRSLIITQAPA